MLNPFNRVLISMTTMFFVFAILRNHMMVPLMFLNCTLKGEQLYNVQPILGTREIQYLYFVPPPTQLEDGYCYYDMMFEGQNYTASFLIHYDPKEEDEWYGIIAPREGMANITIFASGIVEYMIFPPPLSHPLTHAYSHTHLAHYCKI